MLVNSKLFVTMVRPTLEYIVTQYGDLPSSWTRGNLKKFSAERPESPA